MKPQLLILFVLAAAVAASPRPSLPTQDLSSSCAATVVSSSVSTQVGNNTVFLEVLTCAGVKLPPDEVVADVGLGQLDVTTILVPTTILTATTVTVPAPSPTVSAGNDVCGEPCSISCGNLGVLPPDANDCQVVKDAIQILQSITGPTFIVAPLSVQQVIFGTCRFFFQNLGGASREVCWSDLSSQGSLAATSCFPPVQPLMSLAICESLDSRWEYGVSHS